MDESDPNYDITKDPARKAKSKDPGWKYGYWPNLGDKDKVACSLCQKVLSGGIKRLKQHLAGRYGDAMKCPNATTSISQEMHKALLAGARNKPITFDEEIGGGSYGSSNSLTDTIDVDSVPGDDTNDGSNTNPFEGKHPSSGTSSKRKKTAYQFHPPPRPRTPSPTVEARLRRTPEEVVDERRREGASQTTIENRMRTKEEKQRVYDHICDWLFEYGIAQNTLDTRSFEVMIESIGQYGPGLKPPSGHEVRTSGLERAKKKTEELRKHHEVAWKEYGCTLMSDGWTDRRNRHLINFLVNSPVGTYIMGSVDASGQSQDANMLADLLDKKIEEIGPENVVQVVSDNASNYKAAGKILMEKRKTLFWTPCAAHCLDLILEDIGNMKEFKSTITKARGITTFIYRHGRILNAMRVKTKGKELVRPGVTRFATSFLTLQSLVKHKDDLRKLFFDEDWKKCKQAKTEAGKKVADTVFSVQFWNKVQDCIRASQPLLTALRVADGDEKPALPEIYPIMDYAKEMIKKKLDKNQGLLKKVMEIIDKRWESQMQQKLYGAGYFLNLTKYFDFKEKDPDLAAALRLDFNDVLAKMVPEQQLQDKISILADSYQSAREEFGSEMAIRQRLQKNPLDWWISFGGRARELSKFAKRILGLCCSASDCERNWSTFEFIHSKRRNRLHHQRLNDLVFVQYNRRLIARMKKRSELGKNFDPLQLEDFNWDNEWIIDNPSQEQVHPDDDLTYEQVDEAMGESAWSEGRPLQRRAARGRGGGCCRGRGGNGRSSDRGGPGGSGSSSYALHDSDSDEVEEVREDDDVGEEESEPILPTDDLDIEDDFGLQTVDLSEQETNDAGEDDDEVMLDDII